MKLFGFLFPFIFLFGCSNQSNEEKLNSLPITIEAEYMQYACGDWVDDMQVLNVNDTAYNFLLEKDIDPLFLNGEGDISESFYENRTEDFGMSFRLQGFISKCALNGCDGTSPKFWITEIEKLDGSLFNK